MDIVEANRQYQLSLEHERRTLTEFGGVLSAGDIVADAQKATDAAWLTLTSALGGKDGK